MSTLFRSKCDTLSSRVKHLYQLINQLNQKIIIADISKELGIQLKLGRNSNLGLDWVEEMIIDEGGINFINRSKEKYYSYVVYLDKEYHTIGLGFKYKSDIVAPHMDFVVNDLIKRYTLTELEEITAIIDEYLPKVEEDIKYLEANTDVAVHNHYYGEYNKGFDSREKYPTISDVITNYKNL